MNHRFEFAAPARIIFGAGTLREAGAAAKEFGRRALVVTGRDTRRAEPLTGILREHGIEASIFPVCGEPELETVRQGTSLGEKENCEMVVSIGGGSALDAGKAIAAMLANGGDPLDYVELIGRGKAIAKPSAPFIAIPTTAGTGSEVTRNAVLSSPNHRVKVSLRSSFLLPRLAIVDPELTRDLPPALTATTGLDALTQLIEPYVCSRANPMTDALCVEGMSRAARSLHAAFENGHDAAMREDMALASLFGGLALANAGLGAVHGFAGPIGGLISAPHGAIVAALLPEVMAANLRALESRQPARDALRRYTEVARLLTGNNTAKAHDGVEWTRKLVADLKIPRLSSHGLTCGDIPELVGAAEKASSMKANPIALTRQEREEILERAL